MKVPTTLNTLFILVQAKDKYEGFKAYRRLLPTDIRYHFLSYP